MGRKKGPKGQQPLFAQMPKQLQNLPPPPPSGEKLTGEMQERIREWKIIYPCYLNSRKKIKDGRRIAADKACVNPTCKEIKQVCIALGFEAVEEQKAYPRDPHHERFRVRVRLVNEDKQPINPEIPNRRQLLLKLGELIPRLVSRKASSQKPTSSSESSSSSSKQNKNQPKKNRGRKR